MITNNVAGLAGGGISIANALSVTVRQNTIANNDSSAITAAAFSGNRVYTVTAARGHRVPRPQPGSGAADGGRAPMGTVPAIG